MFSKFAIFQASCPQVMPGYSQEPNLSRVQQ
jgi:hypothetical protein